MPAQKSTKRTNSKKPTVKKVLPSSKSEVVKKSVAVKKPPVEKPQVKPPVKKTVVKTQIKKVINKPVKKEPIVPEVNVDTEPVNVPVEVPVPKVPKAPKKAIDKDVTLLDTMLEAYAKVYNTRDTDKNLSLRIGEFSRIIRYVVHTPTQPVLLRMLEFFTKENNAMMSYNNTLRYISQLSATEREKCSTFYTVFTELVDCKKRNKTFSLDINAIGNILQSDPIINFIAMQINKSTTPT